MKKFLILNIILCCSISSGSLDARSVMTGTLVDTTVMPTIPGAYADGVHNDAKVIQRTIDSVAGLGGGIVRFANGKYLTGPFTLKSNITLRIDSSATILASQNVHDYYPIGADTNLPATSLQNLISSKNANNIVITGTGTIDGQGQPWWDAENIAKAQGRDTLRPRLIEIDNAVHVLVDSITLKNAPMFHLCPNTCYDVNIHDIKIQAPSTAPNTDGIDPGKCHHVRISYCTIDNGDDNIAVGSSSPDSKWPNAASSDIIISHCTFFNGHGVSIGSYTSGGVDSMVVDSCTFNGTTNGLRIKTARDRGGNVRNITYSNLTMTNVRYPIYLTEYYPSIPAQTDPAQTVTSTTPSFHDISFLNLTSVNTASNSQAGIIVGLPESKLNNIHLRNVIISAKIGMQMRNATIDTLHTSITAASGSPYTLEVNGTVSRGTSMVVSNVQNLPSGFALAQNYPNPFNPSTNISFNLSATTYVSLKVYDVVGREMATLVSEVLSIGNHSIQWSATNQPSGVYFYRLQAGSFTDTKKLVLIR